ncbi:hypothetical protein CDD83_6052 [Cordyceps sp. RAO-2017]|nr:hypothetical protein CDD83_6052 [Cordyceps sp. RAO-2017]
MLYEPVDGASTDFSWDRRSQVGKAGREERVAYGDGHTLPFLSLPLPLPLPLDDDDDDDDDDDEACSEGIMHRASVEG